MTFRETKEEFEKRWDSAAHESAVLTFRGAEGWTVYNCSVPFRRDGKDYIYGRIERFDEWATSWSGLFEKTGKDDFTLVPGGKIYQLEDPFVSFVGGEIILGGTHVRKRGGELETYYDYFYRGTDVMDLRYFTTGPDLMKDIRLLELPDGRIGVFSRPRGDAVREKYGSEAVVGYTVVENLGALTDDAVENAPAIPGLFGAGEWGGCNQALLLENGNIGVIGHQSYTDRTAAGEQLVYVNIAFEFDPRNFRVMDKKIIGTRSCYPAGRAKRPNLADCTFTSGIAVRGGGKADLYGGLSDAAEGRITIDYPFSSPVVSAK